MSERQSLSKVNTKEAKAAIFLRDWDAEKGSIKKEVVESADFKKDIEGSIYNNYQVAAIQNLKSMVKEVEALRSGNGKEAAEDISFGEFIQAKLGIAASEDGGFKGLMHFLGLNPSNTTIQKLKTMPSFNEDFQWLVPELVRDAIRTGYLANPIWDRITASDTMVNAASIKVPQYKVADTPMYRLNEAETIPLGNMSFDEKTVTMYKVGTGVEITDEVRQFVSVDILSEYLASVGVALTQGLNTLAVQRLQNGDAGASNAASVIGVENIGSFDYDNDVLRLVNRMALLGYMADHIIANEDPAREIMTLPEFKGFNGQTTLGSAMLNTGVVSVPKNFTILPSGVMPVANQLLWLDRARALHKYTSRALFVESDRLIMNQVTRTAATITTGFSKFMRDASIIMDKSIAFSAQGFPTYMDPLTFMVREWSNQ